MQEDLAIQIHGNSHTNRLSGGAGATEEVQSVPKADRERKEVAATLHFLPPSPLPPGPPTGQTGLEASGQGSMGNIICKGQPQEAEQKRAQRANMSSMDPVTHRLWGTGKRRIRGDMTARVSGPGVAGGDASLRRGSEGGAYLGGRCSWTMLSLLSKSRGEVGNSVDFKCWHKINLQD